jgi:hypothetical protein
VEPTASLGTQYASATAALAAAGTVVTRRQTRERCARRIYDLAMSREAKLLWGGLAAAVIGSIQVASIIIRVVSAGKSLTVINGLQLIFCGSLLVVGILTLIDVWRDHSDGAPNKGSSAWRRR